MSFRTPLAVQPPSNINKEMDTPIYGGAIEKGIISPTAQRVLSVTSPSTLLLMTGGENDDAEERQKRRRSIMMEKQSVSSPATPIDRLVYTYAK